VFHRHGFDDAAVIGEAVNAQPAGRLVVT
jgi:hypothetical protein